MHLLTNCKHRDNVSHGACTGFRGGKPEISTTRNQCRIKIIIRRRRRRLSVHLDGRAYRQRSTANKAACRPVTVAKPEMWIKGLPSFAFHSFLFPFLCVFFTLFPSLSATIILLHCYSVIRLFFIAASVRNKHIVSFLSFPFRLLSFSLSSFPSLFVLFFLIPPPPFRFSFLLLYFLTLKVKPLKCS